MSDLPSPNSPVKRHHWIVRLTHWSTFLLLAGMVTSGLQIYRAYARFGERGGPYYVNPFQDVTFPGWTRLGGWLAGGLNWHFALMWPLGAVGLLYLSYLVASGEWRSLLFRPRDIRGAIEMQKYYLRLRKDHPAQGKHNPLQKLAYTTIILLGVLSVHRFRDLQAGAVRLADGVVRRLPGRALLALLGGVDLRRLHARARGARVRRRCAVVPCHVDRLVPREVSEP